ncbi:MAG TPA: metallophosphoesterase [Gaiellaceae bacterium]|nr:metallophosphoesterase [Gaiellaceae bacterium]
MIAEFAAGLTSALALLAPTPASTLLAAGDVASCRSDGDEATAALVARTPGTVAVLGDAVYERGTRAEFARCYSWRGFRDRTRTALGNHEYGTGAAAAAIAYFRLPQRGYYSYELGSWHVVVLNTNCRQAGGCGSDSPQNAWLRRDLLEHSARCTLAYGHHPRWSSGLHGSDDTIAPLWRTLAAGRVDVVLAAHDHHYERFVPIDGIRSFVVGTGGRSHYPVLRRLRTSASVDDRAFGVLRLTLRPDSYDWRFLPVTGSRPVDTGEARCR